MMGKPQDEDDERTIERIAFEARDEPYDAAADFSRSLDACYAVIRARIAAGGEGWEPR